MNSTHQTKQQSYQSNQTVERLYPFQMRIANLEKCKNRNNIPSTRLDHSKNVMNRARSGHHVSTTESLDLLRALLQESMNQEIDRIIQMYHQQYFKLAIDNIRANRGENAVTEYHMQTLFKQILEKAKKMYMTPDSAAKVSTPISMGLTRRNRLNSANRRDSENNFNAVNNRKYFTKRLSTTEMERKKNRQNDAREKRQAMLKKRKIANGQAVRGRPPMSGKSKTIDLGEHNLNKNRITPDTFFVLGSKANRALGFGSARGRLYTKQTDLFKYVADTQDKQYLHERGLFNVSGARAFLIIKEDIEKILEFEEYKDAPGSKELEQQFTLPEFILTKIKNQMDRQRVEREKLNRQNELSTMDVLELND